MNRAHLWGLLSTDLNESDALEQFGHLLGDPTTASFYKILAADLLQTRYPESAAMNPQHAKAEEGTTFDATNSRWHQMLELHEAKQALEKENQELRELAEQQRVQTEEQRARAEEQQAINERLLAELSRLKSITEK